MNCKCTTILNTVKIFFHHSVVFPLYIINIFFHSANIINFSYIYKVFSLI